MARINSVDWRAPTLSPSAVRVVGGQLIESEGSAAGVYTFDVFVPAYAAVLDVVVHGEALWTAGTSATLECGFYSVSSGAISTVIDADDIYAAVDLKATDLLAGESLSLAWAGGKAGDFGGVVATQTQLIDQMDAIDRFIRFKVTTVGTVGTAGKTYVYVMYALPEMDAATFAAS
jgi:hypothetical protein